MQTKYHGTTPKYCSPPSSHWPWWAWMPWLSTPYSPSHLASPQSPPHRPLAGSLASSGDTLSMSIRLRKQGSAQLQIAPYTYYPIIAQDEGWYKTIFKPSWHGITCSAYVHYCKHWTWQGEWNRISHYQYKQRLYLQHKLLKVAVYKDGMAKSRYTPWPYKSVVEWYLDYQLHTDA